jgi:pimeloyl-ACP methyl ester carboxylesterase
MSQKEINDHFNESPLKPTVEKYKIDGRTINFASIGNDSLPTVIFLHGAPGSLSAFIDFLSNTNLNTKAKLVSIDRPGYGYSDFGNSEPSLTKQAELIKPILENFNSTPTILVGHSLGAPIAAKIAMIYPDLVNGLILVAPSIDPELEPDETWFRMPLHTPFLRWMLPKSIRVTNDEIYFLKDELELMLPDWPSIKVPVTVIHGKEDNLVPPDNAVFAQNKLVNASVTIMMIEGVNHFIPWTHPYLIENAIIKHITSLNKKGEE